LAFPSNPVSELVLGRPGAVDFTSGAPSFAAYEANVALSTFATHLSSVPISTDPAYLVGGTAYPRRCALVSDTRALRGEHEHVPRSSTEQRPLRNIPLAILLDTSGRSVRQVVSYALRRALAAFHMSTLEGDRCHSES
jgi:hypothetical protein